MTSKQTAFFIAAVLLGTGGVLYEHGRGVALERQIQVLQNRERSQESEEMLARERDEARNKLQRVAAEASALQAPFADILRMRGELTLLRRETRGDSSLGTAKEVGSELVEGGLSPAMLAALASNVAAIKIALQTAPAQQVPELCLLEEQDWIKAARDAKMDTEEGQAKTLSRARTLAKERLIPMMSKALHGFVEANNGQLPAALTQLGPYFDEPVDDSIFSRYELKKTGNSGNLGRGEMIIQEKDRLTPHDMVFRLGLNGWGFNSPDDE